MFEAKSVSSQILTGSSTGRVELALSRHQGTTEELAVARTEESPTISCTLGPFTQWSSLTRLALPGYVILGIFPRTRNSHEIFPPLLEELQMKIHWYSWFEIICNSLNTLLQICCGWRKHKDSCVPWLNCAIWWSQRPAYAIQDFQNHMGVHHASLKKLSASEKVDVRFEWVTEVFFKDTLFGKRLCEW